MTANGRDHDLINPCIFLSGCTNGGNYYAIFIARQEFNSIVVVVFNTLGGVRRSHEVALVEHHGLPREVVEIEDVRRAAVCLVRAEIECQ